MYICTVSQVIMATNKIESLDPALIRPGRIDRKIEFPLPDVKTKRNIFKIHTGKVLHFSLLYFHHQHTYIHTYIHYHRCLWRMTWTWKCSSWARMSSLVIWIHYFLYNCSIIVYGMMYVGADIKAVCTEAGLLALRERRMKVNQEDFVKAKV